MRRKILIAKLGLDSHWRGAMMVARYLRDRGWEVVFVGNQDPAGIVEAALQEDVAVIGLSSLSGNHLFYVPRVMELLRARGLDDVPVVLGGTIPAEDYPALKGLGVRAIFGPGSPLGELHECLVRLTGGASAVHAPGGA